MTSTRRASELLANTPVDAERPFNAPWEARAFAMAVGLTERGFCTWDEFRRYLIDAIGKADKAPAHGWTEPGEGYYTHFLHALEELLRAKGIVDEQSLSAKLREIGDPH
jgi:nitrile hydratase accessory protein